MFIDNLLTLLIGYTIVTGLFCLTSVFAYLYDWK